MQAPAFPLLILAAVCASAWQAAPPPAELAHKVRELRLEATVKAHGRFVVTGAAKNQTVYQIAVLQKHLSRSTNLLWSVTDPPESRRRILIEIAPSGRAVIRQSVGDGRPTEIPSRRWSEPILNSLVTYEDLFDDYFDWPTQTSAGQEQLGERTCDLIRSEPDSQHPSAYSSITSWIDRMTLLPIKVIKQPARSGPRKELSLRGLRKSGPYWAASTVEFRDPSTGAFSRMVFTAGSENAKVQDREVDPEVVFAPAANAKP